VLPDQAAVALALALARFAEREGFSRRLASDLQSGHRPTS
jgi:hypothetical protein